MARPYSYATLSSIYFDLVIYNLEMCYYKIEVSTLVYFTKNVILDQLVTQPNVINNSRTAERVFI